MRLRSPMVAAALSAAALGASAFAGAASAAPVRARAASGASALASTSSVLVITGAGYGHGIGMSQYGAAGYALHGRGYRFILSHYYTGTGIGFVSPTRTIRVLLSSSGDPSFSGASATPGQHLKSGQRLEPGITYTVAPGVGGALTLSYRQDGRTKRIGPLASPLTVSGPGPLRLAGRGSYDGALIFRPDGTGVQTVESVGLDDYVRGVVAEEMPASWPATALEAQAVAARTYAITTAVAGQDFDVYADARSQMYGGVDAQTPETDSAVAATAGQVVTYRGQPVPAYFFSSSGGHTESIQDEWPGAAPEPWLVGVGDPYDAAEGNPYHRWTYRIPLGSAQAKLSWLLRGKGAFVGIRVLERGTSPRIIWASVQGTRGSTRVSGLALQELFGLPSNWAAFTTITASATTATASSFAALRRAKFAHAPFASALRAAPGTRREHAVRGRVFPAALRVRVTVQKLERGRWRTVRKPVAARGRFWAALPGPGTYRIVYCGALGAPFKAS
jgi:stage II sporulation protein D